MTKLSSQHISNPSDVHHSSLISRIQTAPSMRTLPWRRACHGTTIGYRQELQRRTETCLRINYHFNPRIFQFPYSHRLLRQRTRNSSTAPHIPEWEPASSAFDLSAAPATSALECNPTGEKRESETQLKCQ